MGKVRPGGELSAQRRGAADCGQFAKLPKLYSERNAQLIFAVRYWRQSGQSQRVAAEQHRQNICAIQSQVNCLFIFTPTRPEILNC
jgi:hypothetical protein